MGLSATDAWQSRSRDVMTVRRFLSFVERQKTLFDFKLEPVEMESGQYPLRTHFAAPHFGRNGTKRHLAATQSRSLSGQSGHRRTRPQAPTRAACFSILGNRLGNGKPE
jgi:hypothetical protein